MRPRQTLRVATAAFLAAAVAWSGGFVWFVHAVRRLPDAPPPHTDGIVALTGGAGRVELALRLLATGQAKYLLLSGIGGGTDLATLGHLAGVDTMPLASRITLGPYAASTRGNGVETAVWAKQHQIESLIVVTAAFHMPRALAELRQALPGTAFFPLPVGLADGQAGVEKGVSLRLEAEEYSKYLLTASGLSAWFPHREPAPAAAVSVSAGG
jgi:uncharacterized SAM-binding protein YcdF (DUF218 family)